jgi:hypothetical protein
MFLEKMFSVSVSAGELLDKYTILKIKQEFIHDEYKKKCILDEIKELDVFALDIIKKFPIHYQSLSDINRSIWIDQDTFRELMELNHESLASELAIKFIRDNDKRFRIKNQVNVEIDSAIKEQKSYWKIINTVKLSSFVISNGEINTDAIIRKSFDCDLLRVVSDMSVDVKLNSKFIEFIEFI